MSYIDVFTAEERKCSRCGRKAQDAHHKTYRSEGGSDGRDNLEPLCFHCHRKGHASKGDWQRWGRNGGKQTASNPYNLRNLKQFRGWSDDKFAQWCQARLAKQTVGQWSYVGA